MGVILVENVESGFLIGPIPRNVTLLDPILMIGHVTADNTPDLFTVKVEYACTLESILDK